MNPEDAVTPDDVTEDELVRIFLDTNVAQRTREGALNHPNMSTERLDQIVDMGGTPAERALAMTTATDVLKRWAASPDPRLRALCAFNPSTPSCVLIELADDPEPEVRVNAAMNGSLPQGHRVRVARRDPEPAVREQVMWAMTTVNGRAMLDGARYATIEGGHGEEPPEEYRVLVYPLAGLWRST